MYETNQIFYRVHVFIHTRHGANTCAYFDPISVSTLYTAATDFYIKLGPIDHGGNIYFFSDYQISRLSPGGIVTLVAGSSTPGFVNGPAATAQFLVLKAWHWMLQVICMFQTQITAALEK